METQEVQPRSAVQVWIARGLLVIVIGAPAAASFHGLTVAGEHALGLTGGWAVLVPLVFDAAAAYAAVLALRDVLAGDAAGVNRLLVWAYAIGSAAMNAWYAATHAVATPEGAPTPPPPPLEPGQLPGSLPAALFYAVASVSAVILWDRTLRALRRDTLREQGAVAAPTPRFRLARWIVAPGETRRAWCLAVVEGVSDPATAVRLALAVAAGAAPAAALEQASGMAEELAALPSKADAVRRALAELGNHNPRAVAEWLARYGVEVTPTYVSDVIRRDSKAINPGEPPVRLAAS